MSKLCSQKKENTSPHQYVIVHHDQVTQLSHLGVMSDGPHVGKLRSRDPHGNVMVVREITNAVLSFLALFLVLVPNRDFCGKTPRFWYLFGPYFNDILHIFQKS